MTLPAELVQMEKDFLSGRNPMAYIPLCHALRRQKAFTRALELCQRGLGGDPNSVAGRALYARLLVDLGHYEDALREIARAEAQAPDAMGLMVEKTRCLLRLKRFEEAELVLRELVTRNPLDPEVQLLNTQMRQLRNAIGGLGNSSRDAIPRVLKLTSKEILDRVVSEMRLQVKVLSCAVIPTGAGEPALEGDPGPAEAGYSFFKGVTAACREMEQGTMRVGLMETENAQLIVLVRRNTLVSLCIEPTIRFGAVFHRFQILVSQLLADPVAETTPKES